MLKALAFAICAIGIASAAGANEPFVGRWAMTLQACAGRGDTAAGAVLTATSTTLAWFADYCRIGKMYKAGEAVYVQAHCWGAGDVPVTLAAHGDRMRVTWDRTRRLEMHRCR